MVSTEVLLLITFRQNNLTYLDSRCYDTESPISHSPTLNQQNVKNRTYSMKLRVLGICMFVCIVPVMINSCKVNDKWDFQISRTLKIVTPVP